MPDPEPDRCIPKHKGREWGEAHRKCLRVKVCTEVSRRSERTPSTALAALVHTLQEPEGRKKSTQNTSMFRCNGTRCLETPKKCTVVNELHSNLTDTLQTGKKGVGEKKSQNKTKRNVNTISLKAL